MFKESILIYRQNHVNPSQELNHPKWLRYSYAQTLLLRNRWEEWATLKDKILSWLANKEFEWTQEQIKESVFQVLWFLEQLQRFPKNSEEIERNKKNLETWEQSLEDFFDTLMQDPISETKDWWWLNDENLDLPPQNPEQQRLAQIEARSSELKSYKWAIISKIIDLLWYRQIRELFMQTLQDEFVRYRNAQWKMRKVKKYQVIESATIRQMIWEYLASKRSHWTLIESSKQRIWNLERIRKEAQTKERQEINSASPIESWFLLTQELLWYKRQIQERWFAMTESRKKLFERITEAVMSWKKVFLVWSTWTWKTELAFYTADAVSWKYEVVSWHEWTTPRDLFWYRELQTDELWNTYSWTKPWPVTKAVKEWATVIHDEYTVWTTRSQLATKAFMNAKAGQNINIPWFNWTVFEVSDHFAEIFTWNPKDEKTQAREDMDPAILRMLTWIKVEYMPATEMTKIILANLMEENWIIKLSPSEIELIKRLSRAAELMHSFHDRQFKHLAEILSDEDKHALFWNNDTNSILDSDIKLDKNFLDPWTLFSLFSDLDFQRSKWKSLEQHLKEKLENFLQDPKNENHPEEREIMLKILELTWVIRSWSEINKLKVNKPWNKNEKDFILPSESWLIFWAWSSGDLPELDPIPWDPNPTPEPEPWDEEEIWNKELSELLNKLTDWRYIDIQRMTTIFEKLWQLLWQTITIPQAEQRRLTSMLPTRFWATEIQKIKNMKEKTEWDMPPIMVQFPQKIEINWVKKDFTLKLLFGLVNQAYEKDNQIQKMWVSDQYVKPEQISEASLYDGILKAYTSNLTKDSRNKKFDNDNGNDQIAHQKQVFWPNSEVNQWMWAVWIMRMLDTHFNTTPPWSKQERLIKNWWMRINTIGSVGVPLVVYSFSDDFSLDWSVRDADDDTGFGACLEFPKS